MPECDQLPLHEKLYTGNGCCNGTQNTMCHKMTVISRFAYTCKVPIRLEQVKHNFWPAADPGVAATPAPDQPRRRLYRDPAPFSTCASRANK
jgi:hypothetical protein